MHTIVRRSIMITLCAVPSAGSATALPVATVSPVSMVRAYHGLRDPRDLLDRDGRPAALASDADAEPGHGGEGSAVLRVVGAAAGTRARPA